MLTTDQLQDMVTRIHRVAETHGVPIGHYAGDQCRLVDPGLPMSNASGNIGAIIEEVVGPPFPENGRRAPQEIVREVPRYARNQSHVTREAIGAGLNCGLMAISFVGVVASGAAAAPSGGSSLLAGAIAWTGLVTGSIQCGDSLSRLWVATQRPDSDSLDRADQNPIYSGYRRGVAGLGAAAGGAGLARGTLTIGAQSLGEIGLIAADGASMLNNVAGMPDSPEQRLDRLPAGPPTGITVLIHIVSFDGERTTTSSQN